MIEIHNRRYIGSKKKLVKRIYELVDKKIAGDYSFLDLFAGTGIVAKEFADNNKAVILNDNLYSNYISYIAWFGLEEVRLDQISDIIRLFNEIIGSKLENNYFSDIYGDKYFSLNDAKKIGYIRDLIESKKPVLNFREYAVLITSLLYFADKIANTVGHFESYLSQKPLDTKHILQELKIVNHKNAQIYNLDANELAKKVTADVVYIDPPYNARQYVNFYHVLENLARWNKPSEFEGNSMKFKRDFLKSGYSRVNAKHLLEELLDSLDCKLIVLSYNNTYSAKSTASNNKISETDIEMLLSKKGQLEIYDFNHRYFNAGKTDFKSHVEKLYICLVEK